MAKPSSHTHHQVGIASIGATVSNGLTLLKVVKVEQLVFHEPFKSCSSKTEDVVNTQEQDKPTVNRPLFAAEAA